MGTTKNNGVLWLQKGWKEFATHYSLDHRHMILFQCEETLIFWCIYLARVPLKFNILFMTINMNIILLTNYLIEILDRPPSCKKKTRPKSPISFPQPHKKLRSDSS